MNKKIKIILLHGNGNSTPYDNWFPAVKAELENLGFKVKAPQLPDAFLARSCYWLPFIKNELKADENSILVGHSSGALAAMRYAEENKILGSVLISTMYTHLGIETEIVSGYFDEPWNWQAIKDNQQWIIQFASKDDPWIPIEESRFVHKHLNSEYYEFTNQGHFGGHYDKKNFPELIKVLQKKLVNNAL